MNQTVSVFVSFFVSLLSGLLFGVGMAVSGMIDPAKVVAFLDITGNWDPSLAFVMGGALLVFMPSYVILIKPRRQALNRETYCLPTKATIDLKLVFGAALFGLGWGIAGICPGPAVSSLLYGNIAILVFLLAMVCGSLLAHFCTAASTRHKHSSNAKQAGS